MAAKVAGRVVELLTSAAPVETAAKLLTTWLSESSHPRLGVAGGSVMTALPVLRKSLGSERWRALLLTWVDERVVPVSSPDSNRGAVERSGVLDDGPRALPMVLDAEDGAAACARFERDFVRDFGGGLDVALLGMGEDGHVASLFPGHAVLDAGGLVAHLTDSPKPPRARVTLTLPVLSRPDTKRLVLAMGEGKRPALKRLLGGDRSLPITRLGALTVVTDLQLEAA
jgi:6-phosphogluconolactonase